MNNIQRRVAIIGGMRIPFVKSFKEYSRVSNQEMLTATLQAMIKQYRLEGKRLGDVSLGAIMNSSIDWNLAREVVLGTGLDPRTPAFNIQRACGTSLEAANLIALKIASGQIESGIAGGSDTNSDLPVMVSQELAWKLIDLNNARTLSDKIAKLLRIKFRNLKPAYPGIVEPRTKMSMGQHTEKMVKQWNISRELQDQLALESHQKAVRGYKEGFYADMITPFKGVTRDTMVREDTSLEKLSSLKPAFDKSGSGTLTAGNSTLFSDGAAAVLLCSDEFAASNALTVQAYLTDVQAAAVDFVNGAGLLMAPTVAVSDLLRRNDLSLQDFDFYEIHEAFSGQVLCTLKAWESEEYCRQELGLKKALGPIDRTKMNVKGGSVALGHPFGATGARVLSNAAKLLTQKGKGRALVSVCTAGGMGVAAIVER